MPVVLPSQEQRAYWEYQRKARIANPPAEDICCFSFYDHHNVGELQYRRHGITGLYHIWSGAQGCIVRSYCGFCPHCGKPPFEKAIARERVERKNQRKEEMG